MMLIFPNFEVATAGQGTEAAMKLFVRRLALAGMPL